MFSSLVETSSKNRIQFSVCGVEAPIINSIRKAAHGLVRFVAIPEQCVEIEVNTSRVPNEQIAHVVSLIPVNVTREQVESHNALVDEWADMHIHVCNDGPECRMVTSGDIRGCPPDAFPCHALTREFMPIVLLDQNQTLKLKMRAVVGTAMADGAQFQNALCSYDYSCSSDGDPHTIPPTFNIWMESFTESRDAAEVMYTAMTSLSASVARHLCIHSVKRVPERQGMFAAEMRCARHDNGGGGGVGGGNGASFLFMACNAVQAFTWSHNNNKEGGGEAVNEAATCHQASLPLSLIAAHMDHPLSLDQHHVKITMMFEEHVADKVSVDMATRFLEDAVHRFAQYLSDMAEEFNLFVVRSRKSSQQSSYCK